MSKHISNSSEWTFKLLEKYDQEIAKLADEYRLDTYPNQIEIITAEQMLEAYSSIGMPLGYHHWSFGKQLLLNQKNYRRGHMGLAYEIVINSDPCISYLMEENSMCMQAMVIAHACYGHNSFFKNNYLFKTWTHADAIIDYLLYAKNYITECEEHYGIGEVEHLLDSCHALINYGVDRYKHPAPLSLHEERIKQKNREQYLQSQVNDLWRTIPQNSKNESSELKLHFPYEPQENILEFIEKHAPLLRPWQREIIRIVRKISQYFYPQRQTKVMNEGWACFWHHQLINDLYKKHLVSDEFMLEFLQNHTNVIYQPTFTSAHYTGLNPYSLGFSIFSDIRRICEKPTAEDCTFFPTLVNTDWVSAVDFAMRNFKDESFINQYLSPHIIRKLRLFTILNEAEKPELLISAIHDEHGYEYIKRVVAKQYNLSYSEPDIQVYKADIKGDRSLTLHHNIIDGKPLTDNCEELLKHLYRLWGFPIHLKSIAADGTVDKVYQCMVSSTPG